MDEIAKINLCKCGCGKVLADARRTVKWGHAKNIPAKLCECNCGKYVRRGRKYLIGHYWRNRSHSPHVEEAKRKSLLGNKFWLGRHHTEETKQKLSNFFRGHTGILHTEDFKKQLSRRAKGNKYGIKNKGKARSKESKEKQSLAMMGKIPWNKGATKETDERIKQAGIKESISKKLSWQDIEKKNDRLKKMSTGLGIKPNSIEQIFIDLIKSENLAFKYVGDGTFFLGGKNPDFIDEEKKKIIEIQGCYFHSCPIHHSEDGLHPNDFANKFLIFAKMGFSSIEIWEHEFKNLEALKMKVIEYATK